MSPANIEATLKGASPLIGQACVIGDGRRYNTALLVLDPDVAPAWAARHGIDGDLAALARDERVIAAVQADVDAANRTLSQPGDDQALYADRGRLAAGRRRADADDEAQTAPGRGKVRRRDCVHVLSSSSVDRLTKVLKSCAHSPIHVINRSPFPRKRVNMPRFGSLRGKMLALILTPVAAAIILTTLFAISRASSEQQRVRRSPSSTQRTQVEALKVDQTVGGALATAKRPPRSSAAPTRRRRRRRRA